MIVVVNKGYIKGGNPDMRIYYLMINQELITQFLHNRSDGLAICLRKAAVAVEVQKDIGVEMEESPNG